MSISFKFQAEKVKMRLFYYSWELAAVWQCSTFIK